MCSPALISAQSVDLAFALHDFVSFCAGFLLHDLAPLKFEHLLFFLKWLVLILYNLLFFTHLYFIVAIF